MREILPDGRVEIVCDRCRTVCEVANKFNGDHEIWVDPPGRRGNVIYKDPSGADTLQYSTIFDTCASCAAGAMQLIDLWYGWGVGSDHG